MRRKYSSSVQFGRVAAQRRLPCVHMRVDQAGNHDPAAPVEDIDAGRIAAEINVRAQLDDPVAVNQQIGIGKIAEAIVHRQDGCGLDQGTRHRPLTLPEESCDWRIARPCSRDQVADCAAFEGARDSSRYW